MKIILPIGIVVVVLLIVGGLIVFSGKKELGSNEIPAKEIIQESNNVGEGENQDNVNTISEETHEYPQKGNFSRDNLANPREQWWNSTNDEVAAIDHNGTIAGVDLQIDRNITADDGIWAKSLGWLSDKIHDIYARRINSENVTTTDTGTFSDKLIVADSGTITIGDNVAMTMGATSSITLTLINPNSGDNLDFYGGGTGYAGGGITFGSDGTIYAQNLSLPANVTLVANLNATGSLKPSQDDVFTLGDGEFRWKILYTSDGIVNNGTSVLVGAVTLGDGITITGNVDVNGAGTHDFEGTLEVDTFTCESGECIDGNYVDETNLDCAAITGDAGLCDSDDDDDPEAGEVAWSDLTDDTTLEAPAGGLTINTDVLEVCNGACGSQGFADAAGELYVESNLEVDGNIYVSGGDISAANVGVVGTMTAADIVCEVGNCIGAAEVAGLGSADISGLQDADLGGGGDNDFGDWSCTGAENGCTLDANTVASSELMDSGDWIITSDLVIGTDGDGLIINIDGYLRDEDDSVTISDSLYVTGTSVFAGTITTDHIYPEAYGVTDIGTSGNYFDDINYKDLFDRSGVYMPEDIELSYETFKTLGNEEGTGNCLQLEALGKSRISFDQLESLDSDMIDRALEPSPVDIVYDDVVIENQISDKTFAKSEVIASKGEMTRWRVVSYANESEDGKMHITEAAEGLNLGFYISELSGALQMTITKLELAEQKIDNLQEEIEAIEVENQFLRDELCNENPNYGWCEGKI